MIDKAILKKMPKVELHYHLDGALRPIPSHHPQELAQWFHRGADRKSLSLYLEGFQVTCSVMQTESALKRVAREAMEDLHKEGIVYCEIRFAPILHQEKGLTLEQIVHSVLSGLQEGRESTGIAFGLILCAMRHQSGDISREIAELNLSFFQYSDRGCCFYKGSSLSPFL